jgi:phenylacetic acid degradation operon negative regulatory protein
MEPTARSLTLDLLSTIRRGSMPVRALVAAAELFEIEENSMRVNLARLLSAGSIERDERGRYRLARTGSPLKQQVLGWRDLEGRVIDNWAGDFVAVMAAPTGRRGAGRLSSRALELLGFRALRPGLHVRPDNLVGGVDRVRDRYAGLCEAPVRSARDSGPGSEPVGGAPESSSGSSLPGRSERSAHGDAGEAPIVARLCHVRELDTEAARRLWDAPTLEREYARLAQTLAASAARLDELPPSEAMVESFLVGGRVLRALNLDPLLPDPIVDTRLRRTLVERMRRYDLLGRSKWSLFLAHHGAPSSQPASSAGPPSGLAADGAPEARIH